MIFVNRFYFYVVDDENVDKYDYDFEEIEFKRCYDIWFFLIDDILE